MLLKRTDASGSSVDRIVSCVGFAPGALRVVLNDVLDALGGVFSCAGLVARVFICAGSLADRCFVGIAADLLFVVSAADLLCAVLFGPVVSAVALLCAVLNDVLGVRTQRTALVIAASVVLGVRTQRTALVIAASVLLRAVLIMNGLLRPNAGSAAGDDLGFHVVLAAELLHAVLNDVLGVPTQGTALVIAASVLLRAVLIMVMVSYASA